MCGTNLQLLLSLISWSAEGQNDFWINGSSVPYRECEWISQSRFENSTSIL